MLIQDNNVASSSPGSTVTVAFPVNVTAGNLLIVTVSVRGINTGYTCADGLNGAYTEAFHEQSVAGVGDVSVWYFDNTAGGAATVTIGTLTGATAISVSISEWSGNALSSVVDASNGARVAALSTNTGAGAPVTTTQGGDLVIGVLQLPNDAVGLSEGPPSGVYSPHNLYTQSNAADAIQDVQYYVDPAANTLGGVPTWGWTNSQGFTTVTVAFKAASPTTNYYDDLDPWFVERMQQPSKPPVMFQDDEIGLGLKNFALDHDEGFTNAQQVGPWFPALTLWADNAERDFDALFSKVTLTMPDIHINVTAIPPAVVLGTLTQAAGVASISVGAVSPSIVNPTSKPGGAGLVGVAAISPTVTLGTVTQAAGVASISVAAVSPSIVNVISVPAGVASVTTAAIGATPTISGTATSAAGVAAVSVVAIAPAIVNPTLLAAGVASITVVAVGPSIIPAFAGVAAVGVAAIPPAVILSAVTQAAGVASVTVAAVSPTWTLGYVPAGVASVSVAAVSPTPSASGTVTSAAGVAGVGVVVVSPGVSITGTVTQSAGVAAVTVTAVSPTWILSSVPAGVAGVTVSVISPTVTLGAASPSAGVAAIGVVAVSPGGSGTGTVSEAAGVASVTVAAVAPTGSLSYLAAGVASITVSAISPTPSATGTVSSPAGVGSIVVSALTPPVTLSGVTQSEGVASAGVGVVSPTVILGGVVVPAGVASVGAAVVSPSPSSSGTATIPAGVAQVGVAVSPPVPSLGGFPTVGPIGIQKTWIVPGK